MNEWNKDTLIITNGGKGGIKMNEWINIGIEYPPYDKPVLVTDGESYQIRTLKIKNGSKYWTTDHRDEMSYSASHWMPLPELPK